MSQKTPDSPTPPTPPSPPSPPGPPGPPGPIEQIRAMLAARPIAQAAQTPAQMRTVMEETTGAFPVPENARFESVSANGVPAEWAAAASAKKGKVILYLHGGGYGVGSPKTHRALTSKLSETAQAPVLSLDYRLAPEHPFPAAIDDALNAYRYLLDIADPKAIAVSGDSAGGGLTFALLLRIREEGLPMPAAAAPLSPWVDLTGEAKSLIDLASRDPMVQKEGLLQLAEWYLNGADSKTPLASPIFADLSGLPPLLIHVGSDETLLDDSKTIHANAQKAGVESTLKIWPEMIHVFQAFHFLLPQGVQSLEEIGAFFREKWSAS